MTTQLFNFRGPWESVLGLPPRTNCFRAVRPDVEHDMSQRYSEEVLMVFFNNLLKAVGVNGLHRDMIIDSLITTSLRGVDTHGINLLPLYLRFMVGEKKGKKQ